MHAIRKLFTGTVLRTISLGTLCAIGAFAMGIETAGDVHPFARSQALEQASVIRDAADLAGDIDGDGVLTAKDAWKMLQITKGWEEASADDARRGDTDGDFRITDSDLGHVLHALSIQ